MIPALGRRGNQISEFKAGLIYIVSSKPTKNIMRPCQKGREERKEGEKKKGRF